MNNNILRENMIRFRTKNVPVTFSNNTLNEQWIKADWEGNSGKWRWWGRDAASANTKQIVKNPPETWRPYDDYEKFKTNVLTPMFNKNAVDREGYKLYPRFRKSGEDPGKAVHAGHTYQAMKKRMSKASQTNFIKLLNDPDHFTEAMDIMYYFDKTNDQNKWKNIYIGSADFIEQERIKANPIKKDGKPAKTTIFNAEFPAYLSPSADFFPDNKSKTNSLFDEEVKRWIQQVRGAAQKVTGNANAKFCVIDMYIATSCSRIRNRGDYEGVTWKKLAEDRCNNAYKTLLGHLVADGHFLNIEGTDSPENYSEVWPTMNFEGENGDGSSGPDPSSTLGGSKWFNSSFDGSAIESPGKADKDRKGYPNLLKTKEESNEYKYLVICVDLILINPALKPDEPENKEIPDEPTIREYQGTIYTVAMDTPPRGFAIPWWYPKFDFDWPKLRFKKSGRPWYTKLRIAIFGAKKWKSKRKIDCPIF